MVDLATDWLGLKLRTPLVVGASPLSDDLDQLGALVEAGAGAVVLPSLFEEQLTDEQMAAHRFLDSHVDTDPEARSFLPDTEVFSLGSKRYLDHLERVRKRVDVPVLTSLNGATPGGWTNFAREMANAGASAIELNLYDVPTDLERSGAGIERMQLDTVADVVDAVDVPVTVKLSPFYASWTHFVARVAETGAKGVVLFNRFYQPDIDLETLGVDRRVILSTPAELPLRLHALALLHGRVDLSLASTGGVHSGRDAAKAILSGADAVQIVSALLVGGPRRLVEIREELEAWLDEQTYATVAEARGALAFHSAPDAHAYERVNYARVLKSWRERS